MFALCRGVLRGSTNLNLRHFRSKINIKPLPRQSNDGNTLRKSLAFTVGISLGSFTGAAVWEYERDIERISQLEPDPRWIFLRNLQRTGYKRGSVRQEINQWWNGLSEGKQAAYCIIGLNVLVFLTGKIPGTKAFMTRYFHHSPNSSVAASLLSCFHHSSLLHLSLNMIALQSFSDGAVSILGKEYFLAMYISSGVISSFASLCLKVARGITIPSVGASGAIFSIFGLVCSNYPDSRVCFVFLPMVAFTAGGMLKFMMAFDALGMLMRWRVLDHAAHLSGALCGVFYCTGGDRVVNSWCDMSYKKWKSLREGSES